MRDITSKISLAVITSLIGTSLPGCDREKEQNAANPKDTPVTTNTEPSPNPVTDPSLFSDKAEKARKWELVHKLLEERKDPTTGQYQTRTDRIIEGRTNPDAQKSPVMSTDRIIAGWTNKSGGTSSKRSTE